MSKRNRLILLVTAGVLALAVLVLGAGAVIFSSIAQDRPAPFQPPAATDQAHYAWTEAAPQVAWTQTSADGLKLQARWLAAPAPTDRVVLLIHGHAVDSRIMGGFAQYYRETLGYHVLMPDLRAHGRSEGTTVGYGYTEKKELRAWIDQILAEVGPQARILVHGLSMGAAAAMMLSGEDLPPQVKLFVEDCGYTSVAEELGFQLHRRYGLDPWPWLPLASLWSQLRAGYSYEEASSVKALARNTRPMLFIHGDADTYVPTAMVHQVYAATMGPKTLWIVPGAGHAEAWDTDEAGYRAHLEAFLHEHQF